MTDTDTPRAMPSATAFDMHDTATAFSFAARALGNPDASDPRSLHRSLTGGDKSMAQALMTTLAALEVSRQQLLMRAVDLCAEAGFERRELADLFGVLFVAMRDVPVSYADREEAINADHMAALTFQALMHRAVIRTTNGVPQDTAQFRLDSALVAVANLSAIAGGHPDTPRRTALREARSVLSSALHSIDKELEK